MSDKEEIRSLTGGADVHIMKKMHLQQAGHLPVRLQGRRMKRSEGGYISHE